jgi:cholesterol transport system auxiliary component
MRAVLLAALMPALAACSAVSALSSATTALDVLELQPPADLPVVQRRPLARDIIIEEPTTGGALATDRIMLRPAPLQAQYLPGIRWSEAAPVMLQTLMLRTLDATQAFQYVGRRPLGASGDFAIVTELVDFQAELAPDGDSAQVVVRMISRIVREQGLAIVATRTFTGSATATSLGDDDLAAAFDAAAGSVLYDFAVWTLSSLGAI